MAKNEGKVCDAVVRFLERRERQLRIDVVRPDAAGRASQVDFRLRLGTQVYAIEHTQIEAYENQVRSDRHFVQLVRPVKAKLSGTLPGDAVYDLHFPVETGLGKKSPDLTRAQGALVRWVREAAVQLHASDTAVSEDTVNPELHHRSLTSRPSGIPYEVALHRRRRSRLTRGEPGSLDVARVAPEDLEPSRAERLRRSRVSLQIVFGDMIFSSTPSNR